MLIWFADRRGSRPDGVKGHDFRFWSAPLKFDADGKIALIEDLAQWNLTIGVRTEKMPHNDPSYTWPKKKARTR